MFGERVLQHTIDILMGTNCAHIPADLLMYSYKADLMQMLKKNWKKLTKSIHFKFHYIDDDLSKIIPS